MKIFRESYEATETCNLGCEHHVTYSEVIEAEEVARDTRKVQSDANRWDNVTFLWYADSMGNVYFRGGDWSGTSMYLSTEEEEVGISVRPWGHEVRKDLDGNLLDYWGEVIEGN